MRNLKLGMCYVNKGKAFTVGSGNYKVVLGVIWVFDPSKENKKEEMLHLKSPWQSYVSRLKIKIQHSSKNSLFLRGWRAEQE